MVVLCNLPISHVGGTHDQLAVQLYAGATGVLVPKFNPPELMDTLSTRKDHIFWGRSQHASLDISDL